MRILSIDPGQRTGIAMRDQEFPELLSCMTWRPEELRLWLEKWALPCLLLFELILIERAPTAGGSTRALQEELERAFARAKQVELVSPGVWKPWVKAQPAPAEWLIRARTAHERDAMKLLWYWLQTHPTHTAPQSVEAPTAALDSTTSEPEA